MKTYIPTDKWITPPENQGQIVTVSFALDSDAEVILEGTHDASDGSQVYRAYAYPDADSGEWSPWNVAPKLGKCIGMCNVDQTATNP